MFSINNRLLAIATIRKWYLTLCYDLCLNSIPPIILENEPTYDSKYKAYYSGCTEYVTGFGTKKCKVKLVVVHDTEREYLFTLAHELRHAYYYYNNLAQNEAGCNEYAESFIKRIKQPLCGKYDGIIGEFYV